MQKDLAHVPPGEGTRSLWVFGEIVTYKVTSYRTGGAYSLFEVETPLGGGPPPHLQHREDEAFWVLEGEYEFLDRGHAVKAGAGSLVYVPRGTLHAHKNVGNGPGRMLVSQTPGGLHEGFYEEVGEEARNLTTSPATTDLPEMERIASIAAGYGIEIPLSPRIHSSGKESAR